MVVALLYTCTGKQTDGIDGHKDAEIWRMEIERSNTFYLPIVWSLSLVVSVGSVGSVGSDFLPP